VIVEIKYDGLLLVAECQDGRWEVAVGGRGTWDMGVYTPGEPYEVVQKRLWTWANEQPAGFFALTVKAT
jgi:hypothetical protein